MGIPKILCADCSAHQKTCCQERDIYLTPGDVERIKKIAVAEDFFEFRAPSDLAYLEADDDPMWTKHVFRSDSSRRVLKQDPFGNCVFLSPNGCIMSINERPLVCRLHPYGYTADGLQESLIPDCPVYLLDPGTTLQKAIGLNLNQAFQWHHMLYSEILLEK
jgi:Fe-S-cluster containining protein